MNPSDSNSVSRRVFGHNRLLLSAGLACMVLLILHFVRDAVGREYLHHQRAYRAIVADTGRSGVGWGHRYPLRLRQVVLPEDGRIDRCISCHVGLEDAAMADAEQPLRAHPGSYLQEHDVSTFGCTLCHDGDGRALERDDAHGRVRGGRPVLSMPFLQANCVRCHDPAERTELEMVRTGQALFAEKQCLVCHELDGEGGRLAPDLTRIGDAHPNQKAPVSFSPEDISGRFEGSLNVAYIYESVLHPDLQPGSSFMPDFKFEEEDVLALTVFLKSLSEREAPKALQARRWRKNTRPISLPAADPETPTLKPEPATPEPLRRP